VHTTSSRTGFRGAPPYHGAHSRIRTEERRGATPPRKAILYPQGHFCKATLHPKGHFTRSRLPVFAVSCFASGRGGGGGGRPDPFFQNNSPPVCCCWRRGAGPVPDASCSLLPLSLSHPPHPLNTPPRVPHAAAGSRTCSRCRWRRGPIGAAAASAPFAAASPSGARPSSLPLPSPYSWGSPSYRQPFTCQLSVVAPPPSHPEARAVGDRPAIYGIR
jgi:hypothetical protein